MTNSSLLDQIKNIIARSKDWATLELEYAKLTAAEKVTLLAGAAVTGAVCLLLVITALILFGIALAFYFGNLCALLWHSLPRAGACFLSH